MKQRLAIMIIILLIMYFTVIYYEKYILEYSIVKHAFSIDLYFYRNLRWQKVHRPDGLLIPTIVYYGQILSVIVMFVNKT